MSSDSKSAPRYGVRFTASNSDDEDKKETYVQGDGSPRGRAFANFFEEFEKESDGMLQSVQANELWQQNMRESFENEGARRGRDHHNLEDSYLYEADPDLMYMDRYGSLSRSFLHHSLYSEVSYSLNFSAY